MVYFIIKKEKRPDAVERSYKTNGFKVVEGPGKVEGLGISGSRVENILWSSQLAWKGALNCLMDFNIVKEVCSLW